MAILTEAELTTALARLDGWAHQGNALVRHFEFRDFVEAWGFMSQIALLAQAMDHHPDWSNTYNRVDVALSSHDAGGITERDLRLAIAINDCTRSGQHQ